MNDNEFIEKAKDLYWDGMNRYIQILENKIGHLPDCVKESISEAMDSAQISFEEEMGWKNE